MLVIAGRITDEVRRFSEAAFGGGERALGEAPDCPAAEPTSDPAVHLVKEGSVQSALRFGKPSIDKAHADYPAFFVLNTVLGGFFGSRLMSNIREDKGYTYGIYSGITHAEKADWFYITSEVGIDVCKPRWPRCARSSAGFAISRSPKTSSISCGTTCSAASSARLTAPSPWRTPSADSCRPDFPGPASTNSYTRSER